MSLSPDIRYREAFYHELEKRQFEVPVRGSSKNSLQLDDHQQEAMFEVMKAIRDERKLRAFSIVHSCGAGKTVVEANLIGASQDAKETMRRQDHVDLILATERSNFSSIRRQLEMLGMHDDLGTWGNGRKNVDRPVVLATIQALQSNSEKLSRVLPVGKIDLVIGDEADQYLSTHRKKVVEELRSQIRIGFTATPTWNDGRDISELWGPKIHEMPLREGIQRGVNVPPMWFLYEAKLDADTLKVEKGDYEQKSLALALRNAEIHKSIPGIYRKIVPPGKEKDYPALVYVPSTDLVKLVTKTLQKEFGDEGVIVRGWVGEDLSTIEMDKDISNFKNGKLDILVLCEMGGRGLDMPSARLLLDAAPTLSATKLEQRHGRVLRKLRLNGEHQQKAGKEFSIIVQIEPHSNRFRPLCLPDILDGWHDAKEGRPLGSGNNSAKKALLDEVQSLQTYIEGVNPDIRFLLKEELDMYGAKIRRDSLPLADEDGFCTAAGEKGEEKYGTVLAWATFLQVSQFTISLRLKGVKGIDGLNRRGILEPQGFFPESIVRERCADWFVDTPKTGDDGFFYNTSGIRYGSKLAWAKFLNVSDGVIDASVKDENGIEGLNRQNQPTILYSETVLRHRCPQFFEELPSANADGCIIVEKEKYGTVFYWMKETGKSQKTVEKLCKSQPFIQGRTLRGKVGKFYSQSTPGLLE